MLDHLHTSGHVIQVVRPDGYVFGGVGDASDLPRLRSQLQEAVRLTYVGAPPAR
jgi:hypothetical protein